MPSRRTHFIVLALLAIAVVAVYGRVATDDFLQLDDMIHIYRNVLFSPLNMAHVRQMWTQPYENLYIPLSYSLFGALSILARRDHPIPDMTDTGALMDPHVFHIASLILQIVNALVVFLLLRRMVKSTVPAVFGALLWALHPIQVEAVAWASELRGLLSGLMTLLSLVVLTGGRREEEKARFDGRLAGGIVLGILAMLAKPGAIVAPLLALLIEVPVLHRPARASLIRNGLFLAVLAPFALITMNIQASPFPGVFVEPSLWQRPLVALDAIGFYLEKLVWPWPLLIDYSRTPDRVLGGHWYIATGLLTLAVCAAGLALRKRQPWLGVSILMMIVGLLPVLGFTTFIYQYYSTVADRYAYIALLGPAFALAMALSLWPRRANYVVAGAALVVFAAVSFVQVGYWRNSETLFEHVAAINPNSVNIWNGLSNIASSEGNLNEASQDAVNEVKADPTDYRGYNQLGVIMLERRQFPLAASLFQQALAIHPDVAELHNNMGKVDLILGRFPQAEQEYEQSLRLMPKSAEASFGLGALYLAQHQYDQAQTWFEDGMRRQPDYASSYIGMAMLRVQQNQLPDAVPFYRQALARDPSNGALAIQLGSVYDRLGQPSNALGAYAYAAKYSPQLESAHLALGTELARQGNLDAALPELRQALHLAPTDPIAQRNLQTVMAMRAKRGN